ncbi:MAG: fimbrillin family protein [Muribaculaceae bacterium]|nr:fimbrillin family protein [Muribaculaceae bacterium]
MNRLILAYIFILSCILCACQDIDEPSIAGVTDGDIISLNVTVADNVKSGDPASRAIDNGMSTFFEPGDAVGVIILDKDGKFILNNAQYSLRENTDGTSEWIYVGLTQDIPCYDSEMQTYIVYFPYDKSVTEAEIKSADELLGVFTLHEDQTTEEAYRYSDVMAWESSNGPIKEIKAELRHLRNCVSLDISVRWKLLTMDPELMTDDYFIDYRDDTIIDKDSEEYNPDDEEYNPDDEEYNPDEKDCREVITFKIPNEVVIKNEEGKHLKHFQADDGTFRYILPDGYKGEITYNYNYRQWMYKNKFDIQAGDTGVCYSRVEIAYRGVYKYDEVIVGDFYCKNSKNYGFVLPCEATEYLDSVNHRCIGLVFYTGQHYNDAIENGPSYDYSKTGIAPGRNEEDGEVVECHGYVLALTDAQNDLNSLFEWELDDSYNPYKDEDIRQRMEVNLKYNDWGGYYNTHKILDTCKDYDYYKNWYPAAYAAYYYGNLVSGAVEVEVIDEKTNKKVKVQKNILFNNREDTPSGGKPHAKEQNLYAWQEPLQAPMNTSGWYLPGNGMLVELGQYESLFKHRYEEIKVKLDDKIPYKEHIGWMRYHPSWRGDPYYWSSTESEHDGRALSHEYQQNFTYPSHKSYAFPVRAVLAY